MDSHAEQPTPDATASADASASPDEQAGPDQVVEVTRPSPAGRAVRWVLVLLVASAIIWVLFTTVFPWIERNLSTPTMG